MLILFTALLSFSTSVDFSAEKFNPAEHNQAGKTYTQVYQVRDPRFCHLTPRPFICKDCLRAGKRFARFLSFDKDGRPMRRYGCVSQKRNKTSY